MRPSLSIRSLIFGRMNSWVMGTITILLSQLSWAYDTAPPCMAYGKPLGINNAQVLYWKANTPNQYLARGNVVGTVSRVFPAKPGHDHFEIFIGNMPGEVLEVVYNSVFGDLPDIKPGMNVQACGDYITSIAQSEPYPPSPSGAIIHWVHVNPSRRGHDSGFLMIDGRLYGMDTSKADKRRRHFNEQSAELLNYQR